MSGSIVRIKVASDLKKALDRMPKSLRKASERATLRAGGNVILEKMKSTAPNGEYGALRDSLGLNVKKTKKLGLTVRVGPRADYVIHDGNGNRIRPQKYAHLVEFGTVHSPANPFISRATHASESKAMDAMAIAFQRHFDRTVRRLIKKRASR